MRKQNVLNIRRLMALSSLFLIVCHVGEARAEARNCVDNFTSQSQMIRMKTAHLSSKQRQLGDFTDPTQLINQVVRFENWGTDYLIEDLQLEGNQFRIRATVQERLQDSTAKSIDLLIDQNTPVFPGVVRKKHVDENGKFQLKGIYLGQMVTVRISSDEAQARADLQMVHAVQGQVVFQDDHTLKLRKANGELFTVNLDQTRRSIELVEWKMWGPTEVR